MELNNFVITQGIGYTLGALFSILSVFLAIFYIRKQRKGDDFSKELFLRTRSWGYIALGATAALVLPKVFGTIILAYVSFMALREMISISGFRAADRPALFAAYAAVPMQYYLAYHYKLTAFFAFIPIGMFMLIPFLLIGKGQTKAIGRSMALIPAILMLTVFTISHTALLYNFDIQGVDISYGGLILYLFLITACNDVFQFTWGKLFGKRKIIPAISPNKTWEGFIGGILTTAIWSYTLRYLTPMSIEQSLIMGLVLGIAGFAGDILISAIKRDLNLKDTGDIIPGHGGIMDRLDSLVLTAPIFYHLLSYFLDAEVVVAGLLPTIQ